MDVAIIDTPWNGVWQSMKIAAAAEHFEVNVAPHNFYGHLCTMMNAHFSAAVPNLRIMETDIDRLAWDQELFTHVPEIVDGHLIIPDRPVRLLHRLSVQAASNRRGKPDKKSAARRRANPAACSRAMSATAKMRYKALAIGGLPCPRRCPAPEYPAARP